MANKAGKAIRVRGAKVHNLQNVSLDIPRDKLVVLTGLSGSGKSSLAFDTLYAEGQRKYVESLSAYARQFLQQMQKPDVEHIDGLPPTIAIEQRTGAANPRSTVATTTEIYDYLRLLFARVGKPHCWKCNRPIEQQTASRIVDAVLELPDETRVMVLAPLIRGQKGEHREVFRRILRQGFVRVRVNGQVHEVRQAPSLQKKRKHTIEAVVDRLVIKPAVRQRLADSIELSLQMCDGLVVVAHADNHDTQPIKWADRIYSERYACLRCGVSMAEIAPRLFSFNSPFGACPECDGLGTILEFDPELIMSDEGRSLNQGAIDAWRGGGKRTNIHYGRLIRQFCRDFDVSPDTPFRSLPETVREILLWGSSAGDKAGQFPARFEGVIPNLDRRWQNTTSESVKARLHQYLSEQPCERCHGARLRPEALAVRVADKNVNQVTALTIDQAAGFFSGLELSGEQQIIAEQVLREVQARLKFLTGVGLGYLTLDRMSATLSGGEAQRIRLATQVGSGLVGVCYVLDEPTIGLHQRDNARLIGSLRRLADMGNSVLVVEHDEDTIRAADHVIDMGPGAGPQGGQIVAEGPLERVLANKDSITAKYLRRQCQIPLPGRRRPCRAGYTIEVRRAAQNNLKNIDVTVPLGVFVCVTGVSGSGKSSLITQTLLPALQRRLYRAKTKPGVLERLVGGSAIDKVIEIDQSPIGRTPRSNPATYTGVFDLIRQLYAKTREAKIRGYRSGRFSFNVRGGRCEACQGQGTKRIEMHFLPDVFVTCQECKGTRYNRETLEIRYRGKSIADVLDMTVAEAQTFFDSFAKIKQLLTALSDVGLGYARLGQSSTTLSGGEAQRVKLASELGKSATGHTLYILDEPTTGLHFADIHNLLNVLNRLVDLGNSVLVIEHNLEVIKSADWIIDLGPEGGEAGGRVVAEGTPEQIAKNADSYTGRFLRDRLKNNRNHKNSRKK